MDTPRQPAERSSPSTPDGTGRDEHATPYPAAPVPNMLIITRMPGTNHCQWD